MLAFDDPQLGIMLQSSSESALRDAAFGIVGLDADSRVVVYNRWESELSGLSPEKVLGKAFFTEVAPCTNNYLVALRYDQETVLDETLDYVFSYRLRPIAVRLRLLKVGGDRRWLLVMRRDG
ncbi:MAG: PAS domain-containing protein [Kofleriaceae bacterium]